MPYILTENSGTIVRKHYPIGYVTRSLNEIYNYRSANEQPIKVM
jgi:hypothetical protein